MEPYVAPTRGPGPPHQGLALQARARETLDGIALRVCLQPRLPVPGADLAVGFAPPSQVVESL